MAAAAAAGTTTTSPSGLGSDVKVLQENEQEQRLKNNSSRGSSSRSSSSSSSGGIPSPKSVTSGGNGSAEGEYTETKGVASNSVLTKATESTSNNTDAIGGRLTFYKDGKFIFELAHQRMCNIDEICRWMPVKNSKNHQQVQQRFNSNNKKSWPGTFSNTKEGSASDDNISTVLPNYMFKQHIKKVKRQRKIKTPSHQINCHMQFLMKAKKKFKLLKIKRSHLGKKRKFNHAIQEDFYKNEEKINGLKEEKTVQLTNIGQKKIKKKAQPLYAIVHALWELVVLKESNKRQNDGDTSLGCCPSIVANMSPRKHRLLSNNVDDWVQNKQPSEASPPVDFSPNNKKYCRRNVSSPAAATTPSVINGINSKEDHKAKANNHSINAILASTPTTVPHINNNDLVLTDEPIVSNPQGLSLLRTLLKSPGPSTNGSNSIVSNAMPERLSPHSKQRHKVFSPPIIQSPKRQMYHQTVKHLIRHGKDGIPETNLDSIRNVILMDQRLHHPSFNPLTVSSNNLQHPSLFHSPYHSQQPTPAHLSVPSRSNWSPSHLYSASLPSHYSNMMLLPSSHHHSSTPTPLQQQSPHSPLIVAPYSPCSITSSASVSSPLFSNPSYHQQSIHHRVVSPSSLLFNQHHKLTGNSNLSSATVDTAGTSDDIDVPLNLSKNCSTSSAAGY